MNSIHNLLKDKNILIVEDDKTTIFLIQQLLRQANANIISTSSRMEIEGIIKSGIEIHLVIMEIFHEDEMAGVELIKRLKTTYPMAPVIVQTAITLFGLEEKCFESGSDVFFLKPWSCDALLNSIQERCA